jgi:ribosomal protein L40E
MVKILVYCSNCGSKIEEEAFFCSKCGTKTAKGKNAKTPYPSDEIRDALYQVGIELEKAFSLAAKETQAAFKKVKENFQQKTQQTTTETVISCPRCETKNPAGSIFCNNCGTRLAPVEESHGSV